MAATHYDAMKLRMVTLTGSRYAIHALDWIFRYPISSSSAFTKLAGIPAKTARRLLARLTEAGAVKLVRPGSGRRSAVFCYADVLNIVEGRETP